MDEILIWLEANVFASVTLSGVVGTVLGWLLLPESPVYTWVRRRKEKVRRQIAVAEQEAAAERVVSEYRRDLARRKERHADLHRWGINHDDDSFFLRDY